MRLLKLCSIGLFSLLFFLSFLDFRANVFAQSTETVHVYIKAVSSASDPSILGGDGSANNPYGVFEDGSISKGTGSGFDALMLNLLNTPSHPRYVLKSKPDDTKVVIHLKNGTYLTAGYSNNNTTCELTSSCPRQWTLRSNQSIEGESRDGTIIKLSETFFNDNNKTRLLDIWVLVGDGYKWVNGRQEVPSAQGIKNLTIDANYSQLVARFNAAPFTAASPANPSRINGVWLFGQGVFVDGIRLKDVGSYYGAGITESFGVLTYLASPGVANPDVRYNAGCTGSPTDTQCSRIVNSIYEDANLHASLRKRPGMYVQTTIFNASGSWNSSGTNNDPAHPSRRDVFMNGTVIANNTIRLSGVNGEDNNINGFAIYHTYGGKVFNNLTENIANGYYSDWWQDYDLEIYNNRFLGATIGVDVKVDSLPNFKKSGYYIHDNEITIVPINDGARAGIRIHRNQFNPDDASYYPPSSYARELSNFRIKNNTIRFSKEPSGTFQNAALLITEVAGLEVTNNVFDSRLARSSSALPLEYRYFALPEITAGGKQYRNSAVTVSGNTNTAGEAVDCLLKSSDVFLFATTTHQDFCAGAPVRTLVTPATSPAQLPAGTVNANLSITTNEAATCKYAIGTGTAYAAMSNSFTPSNGDKTHSATVSGLSSGTSQTFSIRCRDTDGVANVSDQTVVFSVAAASTFNISKTDTYVVSVTKGSSVLTPMSITNISTAPSVPVSFAAAPNLQLPVGISFAFSPTACTPSPTCTVNLTITAAPSALTVTNSLLAFALYDRSRALGLIQVRLNVADRVVPISIDPTPPPTETIVDSNAAALSGYAWSSNIGWISFNSENQSSAGGPTAYQVTRAADGTLSGYAWSSNIGWIKFGGLNTAMMPPTATAPGTQQVNARLDVDTGRLVGWARACAGMTDPAACVDTEVPPASTTSGGTVGADGRITDTFDYLTASNGQTSANGTYQWTVPAGVTSIEVKVWGGGGGGSSCCWYYDLGGGGGGGLILATIPVTPGEVFDLTIGNGGTPGVAGGSSTLDSRTSTTVISSAGGTSGWRGGTGGGLLSATGAASHTIYRGGNSPANGVVGSCGGGGGGGGGAGGQSTFSGWTCNGESGEGPASLGGGAGAGIAGAAAPGFAPGGGGRSAVTNSGSGANSYTIPTSGAPGRIVISYAPAAAPAPASADPNPPTDPRGGWKGWISLSGSAVGGTYGVQLNSDKKYAGYAWGSDVIGWIQFDIPTSLPPGPTTDEGADISASCMSPVSPKVGTISTWQVTNVTGGTGAYTYVWSGSDSQGPTGTASTASVIYNTTGVKTGSVTITSGSKTLTASCSNINVAPADGNPTALDAVVSASPASAYINETITWSATVSGCGTGTEACTYVWSGDGGISGSGQSTTASYSTTGVKTGTLTITSGTRQKSASATVDIVSSGGGGGGPGGGGGGGPTCTGVCEVVKTIGLTCNQPTRSATGNTWRWAADISSTFKGVAPYTYTWTMPGAASVTQTNRPIADSFTSAASVGQFPTVSVRDSSGTPYVSSTASCPPVPQENTASALEFGAASIAIPTATPPQTATSYKSSITTQRGRSAVLRYAISGGNVNDRYLITQSGPAGSGVSGDALGVQTYTNIVSPTTLVRGPFTAEGTYRYTLKVFSEGVDVRTGSPKSTSEVVITVRANPDLNEF